MKAYFIFVAACLSATGCNKIAEEVFSSPEPQSGQFIQYTIPQGRQYCQGNSYKPIETDEMKFLVRFDSSAIYETMDPTNQYDINKLYGFSDNNADHHQYSARIGWRWSDKALRLFAYVYNEGQLSSTELTSIPIGQEIRCSIRATATRYVFHVNDTTVEFPRLSKTSRAKGYQLYPYFGGDETAPHEINIWIRNIQ